MKIKIFALALAILAFFIFVGSPFQQPANAFVAVSGSIIAIIIAALAAFGITIISSGGFQSVEDQIQNMLDDYAFSTGTTTSAILSGLQVGSTSTGKIVLNNRFVVFLQVFADYIVAHYQLQDNESKTIASTSSSIGAISLYDLPFSYSNNNGVPYRFEIFTGDGYAFLERGTNNTSFWTYFISDTPNSVVTMIEILNDGTVRETQLDLDLHGSSQHIWYHNSGKSYKISDFQLSDYNIYPNGTINNIINSNLSIVPGADYDVQIMTDAIDLPYDNPEYDYGDGAILDVLADWGMQFDEITYRVIPTTYPEATITYEVEEVVQEQVTDTPAQTNSDNPSDYEVVGITSVFPFCIPFDLYNFFECLAADPVAPSFEWRFYVPDICDETIEIDLSQFDTVAQIVRTMELLAFIVGLAFVTRDKMIKG